MPRLEESVTAFDELKSAGCDLEKEDWSEADTRSKFIDRLLIHCLGWQESDIRRELSECKTRLDYRLSTSRPVIVVEAKKARHSIPLLKGESRYTCKLRKLVNTEPSLRESLEKLADYCHNFSLPFGVLTNGRTYIIINGARTDGLPWLDGKAVLFPDIFADKFSFSTLHSVLSRSSVVESRILAELNDAIQQPLPSTVLLDLPNADAALAPEPIVQALNPVLDRIFTDVVREEDEELVIECYVKPGESRLRDDTVEQPLLDRPPETGLNLVDIGNRASFDQFERTIMEHIRHKGKGSTIIIIGNIGVGKTMFRRVFFSRGREQGDVLKKTIPFVVDFRTGVPSVDNIESWVYLQLRQTLNLVDDEERLPYVALSTDEALSQIFHTEVRQFDRISASLRQTDNAYYVRQRHELLSRQLEDNRAFVPRAIKHITTNSAYTPCIVLDNADHHTPEIQEKAYLVAKTLEQQTGCLVLLMVQEAWYWHFKKVQGPLASYQDTIFHIPAPRMRDVLFKRLDFAIKKVNDLFPRNLVISLPNNMALQPTHVARYLTACKQAFFHDDTVTVCYECLANKNIRRGLELFCTFVRSGHKSSVTALYAVVAGESLSFSLDDVIAALACGTYRYYSAQRSLVPNLFTQFLTPNDVEYSRLGPYYLLSFCASKRTEHTSFGDGFISYEDLVGFMTQIGIDSTLHEGFLRRLCDTEMLETPQLGQESHGRHFHRATALGLYMVKSLVRAQGYLATVAVDTPIRDSARRHNMVLKAQESVTTRAESMPAMKSYLLDELKKLEDEEYSRLQGTFLALAVHRLT
jgi:hypothetical protein